MESRFVGLIAFVVLVFSACGGGDDVGGSAAGGDTSEAPSSSASAVNSATGENNGDSAATVTIGSDVHELEGSTGCVTGSFVSVTFENDSADRITMNDPPILIRVTLDGVLWVNDGGPSSPAVTDDGSGSTVTWSGEMSVEIPSRRETVSIEVHCI